MGGVQQWWAKVFSQGGLVGPASRSDVPEVQVKNTHNSLPTQRVFS